MFLIGLFVLSQVARPETVLVCRFGKDKGQIGVTFADMAYGPGNFRVDEQGNIYIWDSEHIPERIQIFSKDGKLMKILTGKEMKEIKKELPPETDYKGYMHRLGYNAQGFVDREIILSPDLRDTIAIIKRKDLRSYYSYDRMIYRRETINGKIDFYKIKLQKTKSPIMPKKELIEKYDGKDTILWRMVGEDMEGNFYFLFVKGEGKTTQWFLKKFNHNGKYLGQIKYEIVMYGDFKTTYLSPTGDFYVANMDNEKYWIVKYPKEMFKK